KIGPTALVVPGIAPYRPVSTAFGVVAAELAALIVLSFRVRAKIGAKAWRRLHWATFAIFLAATVHGLGAGTDTGQSWSLGRHLRARRSVGFAIAPRGLP